MAYSLKGILESKNDTNNLGLNGYDWFFMNLENNYVSKLDGVKRNVSIVERYDKEAQVYIIRQLAVMNTDAANDLLKELKLNFDDLSLSDELEDEIKQDI